LNLRQHRQAINWLQVFSLLPLKPDGRAELQGKAYGLWQALIL
jgi:hypothetical protein